MVLAIDIGNSTITVGLFRPEGTLKFRATLKTVKESTRDQLAIDVLNLFRLHGANMEDVSGTIISSVVPPLTKNLTRAVKFLTDKNPLIVGSGIKTGINILAESHGQLGADLVACSVACIHKYPSPVILIDIGTATSLSVLKGNTFLGCAICPGLSIGAEALAQRGAELPQISIEPPTSILGRNTIDAMSAGVVFGHAAMVDDMIRRMEEASQEAASVVMTGELGMMLNKYCKREIIYDGELLLDGLFLLYEKNQPRQRK